MGDKRVIVYGYNASPFYNKVLHLLAHYRVPFDVVKTGIAPPRPMLSDELNITYRKIPTLVLDGQMYLDTSVIAEVLEETFGGKPGHGPKLLSQQHVMQRRITLHWLDQHLFAIGASLIPIKLLSKEFLADRASFGAQIGKRPLEESKADLRVQLSLLEEQLQANASQGLGPYLLGTSEPQYVDLGAYNTLNWIQTMQKSAPEYLPMTASSSSPTPFPAVVKFMATLRNYLQERQTKPLILEPRKAAKMITEQGAKAAELAQSTPSNVDEQDPLVQAGWLRFADQVDVTPIDTGRVPQRGKLVGLSTRRISLIVHAGPNASHAPFLAHFPRPFFKVQRAQDAAAAKL